MKTPIDMDYRDKGTNSGRVNIPIRGPGEQLKVEGNKGKARLAVPFPAKENMDMANMGGYRK